MKSRSLHLILLAAVLLVDPTTAEEPKSGTTMVVSGFEPFGGRKENASFVLAKAMAEANSELTLREIPVLWGAPAKALAETKPFPKLWLAFGEGTPVFQLETVADNQRENYPDNQNALPPKPQIDKNGPDQLIQPLALESLATTLTKRGYPTRISKDAGGYLCEEMLFSLLTKARQFKETGKQEPVVLFIHVPPLGTKIPGPDGSPPTIVDKTYLTAFGKILWEELAIHLKANKTHP